MYNDDYDRSGDEIYSKPVRAGKRTYFFDVKSTKGNNDFYLTITESKRKIEQDGRYVYDKHKIFLYKEDFEKFMEGMQDVISYIKNSNLKKSAEDVVEPEEEETIHGDSPEEDMASGDIKLDIEF